MEYLEKEGLLPDDAEWPPLTAAPAEDNPPGPQENQAQPAIVHALHVAAAEGIGQDNQNEAAD